jgi:hypothetical protein
VREELRAVEAAGPGGNQRAEQYPIAAADADDGIGVEAREEKVGVRRVNDRDRACGSWC